MNSVGIILECCYIEIYVNCVPIILYNSPMRNEYANHAYTFLYITTVLSYCVFLYIIREDSQIDFATANFFCTFGG